MRAANTPMNGGTTLLTDVVDASPQSDLVAFLQMFRLTSPCTWAAQEKHTLSVKMTLLVSSLHSYDRVLGIYCHQWHITHINASQATHTLQYAACLVLFGQHALVNNFLCNVQVTLMRRGSSWQE